jgi:hypothetical protein
MSDHLVAETSTCQHTTHTTDKHPYPRGIWTHNHSRRVAVDLRLIPRGLWDQRINVDIKYKYNIMIFRMLSHYSCLSCLKVHLYWHFYLNFKYKFVDLTGFWYCGLKCQKYLVENVCSSPVTPYPYNMWRV